MELVYGRWFWFAKERLTIGQCAAASLLLIALMYELATLNLPTRVKRKWRKLKPAGPVPETT